MNLYEDIVAAFRQSEATSNTGTVQNGRKSETYHQYSMQTWVLRLRQRQSTNSMANGKQRDSKCITSFCVHAITNSPFRDNSPMRATEHPATDTSTAG